MKITEKELIDFTMEYGDTYKTTVKDLEFVGIPRVLKAAEGQLVASSVRSKGLVTVYKYL